jgi:predicted RNase H-like HicB family nuclease
MFSYPVRFTADRKAGGYVISFADVRNCARRPTCLRGGFPVL